MTLSPLLYMVNLGFVPGASYEFHMLACGFLCACDLESFINNQILSIFEKSGLRTFEMKAKDEKVNKKGAIDEVLILILITAL